MGWIYGIRSPKLKEYIGQTTHDDVNVRWNQEKNNPHCILKKVFEKYGTDKCEFFTIMEISQETHGGDWKDYLNMYEKLYIKERNTVAPNGYNLMTGGGNSQHNEESIKKMSKAKMGNTSKLGQTLSDETKKKIGEAKMGNTNNLGKIPSDESKQKNSDSHPKKSVEQWDDGVLIKIYQSMREAVRQTLIHKWGISQVCNGMRKTAGGYTWKYYVPIMTIAGEGSV